MNDVEDWVSVLTTKGISEILVRRWWRVAENLGGDPNIYMCTKVKTDYNSTYLNLLDNNVTFCDTCCIFDASCNVEQCSSTKTAEAT